MTATIAQLQCNLATIETNEAIFRKEGTRAQADSHSVLAAEMRQAIAILIAANNGPIWPKPSES